MESTDETNVVSTQNNYGEVDNFSETSTTSTSSFVDDTKKRNSLISFEDDKDKDNIPDEKEEKIKTKRTKRNSFRKLKERSLSFFNKEKDKDNKRNSTVESEKHLRPTSRASYNDAQKNRFSLSDDGNRYEIETKKARRSSNPEIVERDDSIKRANRANRLSVNLGNLNISKMFRGSDETKPSQKPIKPLEDFFLEPGETMASPKSPRIYAGPPSFSKNKQDDYVESPRNIRDDSIRNFPRDDSKNNFTDESPNDDIQSINSSTRPSSVDDDHFYNPVDDDKTDEPTSPSTPKLIITQVEERDHKSDDIEDSFMDSKEKEFKRKNLRVITNFTDDENDTTQISNKISNFNSFQNNAETVNNTNDDQILKKLQELENINKSLNDAKTQLEAKIAEQDDQIDKFNSVEQIIKQQVDLSNRMTETMQRLESKSNVEELDSSNVGKVFEDTIKRLEDKIDKQNEEIGQLKSIVGQLTGNPQFFLTNGDFSQFRIEGQNLIMTHQEEEENQSLIQTNPSQAYSNTLVNTLVVSPICMSATIAASVLHAVYVRPVIGLIKVVREISTAGRDLVIVT